MNEKRHTLNISSSFFLLYIVPISSPSIKSNILLMGQDAMNVMAMKILVSHRVLAPICKPYREHTACGTISPNTTIAEKRNEIRQEMY